MALAAVLAALAVLFGYAALRTGPLAPVLVTLARVEHEAIAPALFGIGTVEAKATHRIGPTFAGRIQSVAVQVGDPVRAGQVLGEMDPIDLDARIGAQDAALKRALAAVLGTKAQLAEIRARHEFAVAQLKRYEHLLVSDSVSHEAVEAKRQDRHALAAAVAAADANVDASRQELARLRAEREAMAQQRTSLRLVAPVDGLVTRRDADPGTTVVAGQAVIEVVEPGSLWISARFDQQRAAGLKAGLPAQVVLRSQGDRPLPGSVVRVEPHADAVTEEFLAKVAFESSAPPPIGELAEVTVALSPRDPAPVVSNASLQRVDGRVGVWVVEGDRLQFAPVTPGAGGLDGRVQILQGLRGGEQVVVHSEKALEARSRIKIVTSVAPAAMARAAAP